MIFPDYTKTQRNKFIQALVKGIPPGVPSVLLVFRNKGRFSRDNQAPAKTTVPDLLGPRPDTGNNQMEIRGVVSFHRPDCGFRGIADRIPTQAGQRSDDCGQPMKAA